MTKQASAKTFSIHQNKISFEKVVECVKTILETSYNPESDLKALWQQVAREDGMRCDNDARSKWNYSQTFLYPYAAWLIWRLHHRMTIKFWNDFLKDHEDRNLEVWTHWAHEMRTCAWIQRSDVADLNEFEPNVGEQAKKNMARDAICKFAPRSKMALGNMVIRAKNTHKDRISNLKKERAKVEKMLTEMDEKLKELGVNV